MEQFKNGELCLSECEIGDVGVMGDFEDLDG